MHQPPDVRFVKFTIPQREALQDLVTAVTSSIWARRQIQPPPSPECKVCIKVCQELMNKIRALNVEV